MTWPKSFGFAVDVALAAWSRTGSPTPYIPMPPSMRINTLHSLQLLGTYVCEPEAVRGDDAGAAVTPKHHWSMAVKAACST